MRRFAPPALLLFLLAGAGALRARGLGVHPIVDETQTVATALLLEITGDSLPPETNWPPFVYSLVRAHARALVAAGFQPSVEAMGETIRSGRWYRETTPLHLQLRLLALVVGTGLVLAGYILGRLAGGRASGLVAAGLVAVAPLAVEYSRFVLTEGPHALAATLALALALRAASGGGALSRYGGFALAGVAFATKYLGGTVALASAAALALRRPRPAGRSLLGELALGALAFGAGAFAAAPSLFLHAGAYLRGLGTHAASTGWSWLGFEGERRGWIFHLARTIPWGFGGFAAMGLAAAGLVLAWRRDRRATAVLLAFALPYYALVGANRILFARYLLPLVPVFAALAGVGAAEGAREAWKRWRPAALVPVALAAWAIASCAVGEFRLATVLRRTDTRRLAGEWIEANLPAGTRVLSAYPLSFEGSWDFLSNSAYPFPPSPSAGIERGHLLVPLEADARFGFEEARERFDVYLRTSFVDDLLEAKPALRPNYAKFARALRGRPVVARFDPGGSMSPILPAPEYEMRAAPGDGAGRPGPRIEIVRLRGDG